MQARDPLGDAPTDRPRMARTNVVPTQISAAEKLSQRDLPAFSMNLM